MLRAARSDPSVPNSGTGLPPWVHDVEAFATPGMKDPWPGKPIVNELFDPFPRQVRSLATARKHAPPEVGDVEVEDLAAARSILKEFSKPRLVLLREPRFFSRRGIVASNQ